MTDKMSKFLEKALVLTVIFANLAAFAASEEVSFDPTLHYCVNEQTKQGPIYLKKGHTGPCHDFTGQKLGALFRFKLLFVKDLSGSSFQGIKVKKLKFQEKKLEGVNFSKAEVNLFIALKSELSYSNFTQANVQNADLHAVVALSSQMKGVNLHGSNLSLGRFDNSVFEEAILTSRNLRNIECRECVMKNVKGQQIQAQNAHFEGANFEGAELKFGQLSNANFEKANLHGADFSSAELDGVQFKDADLTGAIFHTANLKGADLSTVKGEEIKWRFAKFDSSTKLPFSAEDAVQQYGMILTP